MKEEYKKNEKFRKFVDAYCVKYKISVETALAHAIVKGVGNEYRREREEKEGDAIRYADAE